MMLRVAGPPHLHRCLPSDPPQAAGDGRGNRDESHAVQVEEEEVNVQDVVAGIHFDLRVRAVLCNNAGGGCWKKGDRGLKVVRHGRERKGVVCTSDRKGGALCVLLHVCACRGGDGGRTLAGGM